MKSEQSPVRMRVTLCPSEDIDGMEHKEKPAWMQQAGNYPAD
jgi:hypothetical protein